MPANIFGQRFYGNRIPAWHTLGVVSQTDQNAVDALTSIGGGYWFEKRPVTVEVNGVQTVLEDRYAIVRSPVVDDPTERVFDFVTGRYQILQPLKVCEIFDEKVRKPVETLGFLGSSGEKRGDRMFLTWKLPAFDVVKGDTVTLHGFIAIGFDALMGASLNVVTCRVVCENTWKAALQEAESTKERGKGRIWAGKHTNKDLEGELGEWMEYVQTEAEKQVALLKSFFKMIAKTPVQNDAEVEDLLVKAYPDPLPLSKDAYMPLGARKREEQKIELAREVATKDRAGIMSLWGGAGTKITPDYWGVFNATTEWFNFGKMEKKPAYVSIMDGARASSMNRMVEVLTHEAEKKAK